jgi:hypothetical protein
MAYVLEDEEEKKRQGPAGFGAGGLPTLGAAGTSAPVTPASKSPAPAQTGTGFVGWDQILSANKDASAARAGEMAEGMEAAGKQVKEKQTAAQQRFDEGVQAGTPAPRHGAQATPSGPSAPNAFGQPTSTPRVAAAPQPTQGAFRPATAPANFNHAAPVTNAGERAAAQADVNARYDGPQALSDDAQWEDILNAGRDVESRIGSTQTPGGLEALVQEKAPQLGSGGSRMDAALLGATGQRRFDELRKEYGGLLGGLKGADAASRARTGAIQGGMAERSQSARGAISAFDASEAEKQRLQDEADRAREKQLAEEMKTGLYDTMTDEQLEALYAVPGNQHILEILRRRKQQKEGGA